MTTEKKDFAKLEKKIATHCDSVLCTSFETVSSNALVIDVLKTIQPRLATIVSIGSLVADLAIKKALLAGVDVATHPLICDQQFFLACFRTAFKTQSTVEKSVGLSKAPLQFLINNVYSMTFPSLINSLCARYHAIQNSRNLSQKGEGKVREDVGVRRGISPKNLLYQGRRHAIQGALQDRTS